MGRVGRVFTYSTQIRITKEVSQSYDGHLLATMTAVTVNLSPFLRTHGSLSQGLTSMDLTSPLPKYRIAKIVNVFNLQA